jgi:hypothetical protein
MKKVLLYAGMLSSLLFASGPVYKTGQNWSIVGGDDSFYQSGITPNFKKLDVNGNVILDTRLGLYWQNDHKIDDSNASDPQDTWPLYDYDGATNYCQNLSLLNRQWRLPTRLEAKTVLFLSYDYSAPRVNTAFRDTVMYDSTQKENGYTLNYIKFWTATESSNNSVWIADYYNGIDRSPEDKSNFHNVRCVSGDMNIKSNYRRDDGVVIDTISHLMWQDDYDNDTSTLNDSVKTGTWEEALEYCETLTDLGHNDWKVPNFSELYSITDTNYSPAINPVFKNVADNLYWSSTSIIERFAYKFVVNATSGADTAKKNDSILPIRCVRTINNAALPSIVNYLLN